MSDEIQLNKRFLMHIGGFIRRYRAYEGLTQKELGERVGVQQLTIHKWESGCRQPRVGQMIKILEVLGCAEQFFEEVRESLEQKK